MKSAPEPASACVQIPKSVGKRPKNLARSPPQVVYRRKKSVRSYKWISLQKPPVITCGFHAQEFSTRFARRRSSSYSPSLNMVLTHLTVRAVTYLRLLWNPIKLSPGETTLTQPNCRNLSTNRLNRADSQLVPPYESDPAFYPPERLRVEKTRS